MEGKVGRTAENGSLGEEEGGLFTNGLLNLMGLATAAQAAVRVEAVSVLRRGRICTRGLILVEYLFSLFSSPLHHRSSQN